MKELVVAVASCCVLLSPALAAAEDPVRLPEVIVRAAPPRPAVTVVLPRTTPSSRLDELHASFTPEIVASTSRAPF